MSLVQPSPGHPLADFKNFLYLAWKFLNLPEPTTVQYEIADLLQAAVSTDDKDIVIEAFRGVGKSWITAVFVLWLLYWNADLTILVVSASKQRSDEFSNFCHKLILEWRLIAKLKPTEGQRWAVDKFDVGGAGIKHQPSVKAAGLFGQITGSRADIIIADDVEVPNNSETHVMREKLVKRVAEFSAILKPGGSTVFLGTPQTEDSIYNKLALQGFKVFIFPARYPNEKQRLSYGQKLYHRIAEEAASKPALAGKPTDPKRFDETDLAVREAKYGRSGFALQFMLDTSFSDMDRFPLKLSDLVVMNLNGGTGPERADWSASPELVWKDLPNVGFEHDRFYRPIPMTANPVRWVPYEGAVLAIDPSGRGKDETAYAVVKRIGATLFLTRSGGFAGNGFEKSVLEKLATVAAEEKVNYVLVEENAGMGMFSELFKPVLAKFHSATIEEVRHSRQKELRICDTLEPVLNQHRLVVAKKVIEDDYKSTASFEEHKRNERRLFYQISRMSREKGALPHDDRVDVLAMAVAYWVKSLGISIEKTIDRRRQKEQQEWMKDWVGGSHRMPLNALGLARRDTRLKDVHRGGKRHRRKFRANVRI